MGACYPGPVSRHNLVCSFLFLWYLVPVWDRFATTVAVGAFGRHGATQDLAQRAVGQSGRESVMAVDRFYRNAVSAHMGVRGRGFRGVGTVC